MRLRTLICVLGLAAACGGSGGATPGVVPTAAGQPTPPTASLSPSPSSQPTQAGAPTPTQVVPVPGAGSMVVTLTGGPDAGTFTVSDNPNCTTGLIGPNGWAVQYSIAGAADNQMSSLQIVQAAPGKADDENAFYKGTEFSMTVTIGDIVAAGNRDYEIAVRTESADKETVGTGSAQIADAGSSAVIHATGTTADGVAIDATVSCPSVTRL